MNWIKFHINCHKFKGSLGKKLELKEVLEECERNMINIWEIYVENFKESCEEMRGKFERNLK